MAPTSDAEGMLRIAVRDVAGKRIEVEIENDKLVYDLKRRIDAAWRLPCMFQRLISPSCKVLKDHRKVKHLHLDEGAELTLVLTLETAREYLRHGGSDRICDVLGCLSFLGTRGGPEAIDMVCSQLGAHSCDIRRIARCSFENVARRDDPHSMSAVCACFDNPDWRARCGAVAALARLAKPGDREIIDIILAQLDDHDGRVRYEVAQWMPMVSEKGDSAVMSALGRHLDDKYCWLRQSIIESIAAIAKKGGDPVARDLISTRLDDEVDFVRDTAKQCLAKIDGRDEDPEEFDLRLPPLPEFITAAPKAVKKFVADLPIAFAKLVTGARQLR